MFAIEIEQPDWTRTIEDVTAQIMKSFVEDAPMQFAQILDNPPPSSKGSPPAKRSGALIRSLKARVTAPDEAELEMINYATNLDAIFGEKNYDRPFVRRGIARTLADL